MGKIFVTGIYYNDPKPGLPDYVIGGLTINSDEFIDFINKHNRDGKLYLDIKKSQKGKYYLQLWEKEEAPSPEELSQDPDDYPQEPPPSESNEDTIPF